MKTKPFSIKEAKAGAKVVNRAGETIRIVCYDSKYSLQGRHQPIIDDLARTYCDDGVFNPLGIKSGQKEDLLLVSEPKLRPWKPEEIVLPLLIRSKDHEPNCMALITGMSLGKMKTIFSGNSFVTCEDLFNDYEHSTDSGKTWKPCGVEE